MAWATQCPQLSSLRSFNAPKTLSHSKRIVHQDNPSVCLNRIDSRKHSRAFIGTGCGVRRYLCRAIRLCPSFSVSICSINLLQARRSSFARRAEEATEERYLDGADAELWDSSLGRVQALGFEEEEAQAVLEKAFGWSGQGYWRNSKEYEVPQPGQVDAVADFLTGLGLAEMDVTKAVKVFPQILGLPVEEQLRGNVEKLKKDWKMTDKVIPGVIKRQPQVLGYNVDCEGNCLGECNRCWVRF